MSMQIAGQVVGGVIGSFIPGVGTAVGMWVGGMIGGMMTDGPVTDGPRLSDTKISDSSYGKAMPWVIGRQRVAGQLIWSTKKLKEIRTEEDAEGGKGDGPKNVVSRYYFTGAIALCQAPEDGIEGLGQGWASGEVVFDARSAATEAAFEAAGKSISPYMTLYDGRWDQQPDPVMRLHSPTCSAYRGIAYLMFVDLPVENFGNRMPNLEFEVIVGRKRAKNVDYGTPEMLSYVDDNGSQSGLYLGMHGDRTDTLYGAMANHVGGFLFTNTWATWTLPIGGKPKRSFAHNSANLGSSTTPPMLYGADIEPTTPMGQRGQEGIDFFSIKSRRPLYGVVRRSEHTGTATEAFVVGAGVFPRKMYNNAGEVVSEQVTPSFAVVIDELAFFAAHLNRNRLYKCKAGEYALLHAFPDGEEIQSFADAGSLFYVATRDASKVRVYEFGEDGPTGLVVEHYFYSNAIRLHATLKGVVFICFQTSPIFNVQNMLEIAKWDPQNEDGFSLAGRAKMDFVVPSGEGYEHLGDAQGQLAHVGAAASGNPHDFFWTDGARAIFDAGIGIGANDGYGGDGICGVVFGEYTKFGGDIEDVSIADVINDRCRAAGLPDDAYDTSELAEDYLAGYTIGRTVTGRGACTPLQSYVPFDAVESGGQIKFRRRGKAEVMTIDVEEMLGVEDEA